MNLPPGTSPTVWHLEEILEEAYNKIGGDSAEELAAKATITALQGVFIDQEDTLNKWANLVSLFVIARLKQKTGRDFDNPSSLASD